MPVMLNLLHEGFDEARILRAVPMCDRGTVFLEVHHQGAGDIGGASEGVSPHIEVLAGELLVAERLITEGRRSAAPGFDAIDDHLSRGRAFCRLRFDPAGQSLVLRIVDLDRPRSCRADWPDAPGAITVLAEDWCLLLALVGSQIAQLASEPQSGSDRAIAANGHPERLDRLLPGGDPLLLEHAGDVRRPVEV